MSSRLLERTPNIREWPPFPADGSVATANPPPFRWLLHDGVELWKVILTGPKGQRQEYGPLPDPILALPKELTPGDWRWQIIGLTHDGQEIGRGQTRTFTVRLGAKGFAMPSMVMLERRLRAQRPRILPRRIQKTRRLLKREHPEAFRRLQEWCRLAENASPLSEPENFGPHSQDTEEWNRDWVRIFSAARVGSAHAARFALSFLLTGNPKHRKLAKQWAMNLVNWDPCGVTSAFVNDEASMPMLERLAWVYDWLHPYWSDDERRRYHDCMLIRGQEVFLKYRRINFAAQPFNNHMCRQLAFLGGAGVAFLGEIPQASDWLAYVLSVMTTSYPSGSWGSDDGGWANGLSYWASYMSALMTFLATADELGLDLIQGAYYRNTGYFSIYHLPLYAPSGGFGDHGMGGPGFLHKLVIGAFGRMEGDKTLCEYADGIKVPSTDPAKLMASDANRNEVQRWDAWNLPELSELLLIPPLKRFRCVAKSKYPSAVHSLPAARHFPAIGWVSMHSELGDAERDAWLEFKSSPFGSPSHSHADQNSFNLYAGGEYLLIDSGYYPWCGSPHDSLWTRQTWAHNAVLVGGHGQATFDWNAKGQVELFAAPSPFAYARGEAAAAYNQPANLKSIELAKKYKPALLDRLGPATEVRQASRTVLMLGGQRPWFAVFDWLETATPVKFQWLAHSLEVMKIIPSKPGFDVRRGDVRLAVRFAAPGKLAFSQSDRFFLAADGNARNEPNQWHLQAETIEPARTARFAAALFPWRDKQEMPVVSSINTNGMVGLREGNSLAIVPEHGTRGWIRIGAIEAQCALLAIHEGRLLAAEATRLIVNGKTVLDTAQPQTVTRRYWQGTNIIG